MSELKIVTWNVNSIRSRLERALALLDRLEPDVLCLQEIKVVDDGFPREPFAQKGYHAEVFGQKTYNGVALLSRLPLTDVVRGIGDGVDDPQARVIGATVEGVKLLDLYVPNGSEVGSEKFAYKLEWLARLRRWLPRWAALTDEVLLCGDFNIAPDDRDVHDPEQWRGRVLFHPDEHRALAELCEFGLQDAFRLHHDDAGHYTWWDYRAAAFRRGLGLRIDHVLVSAPLARRCSAVTIDVDERRGPKPSDHAPVVATFHATT